MLDIFHRGSMASALAVHLSDDRAGLSREEIEEIKLLIEKYERDKA